MEKFFNFFVNILEVSAILGIIIIAFVLLCLWLFLKSAIAKGVEDGYYNALTRYDREKNHPRPTPQEELEEELKGW